MTSEDRYTNVIKNNGMVTRNGHYRSKNMVLAAIFICCYTVLIAATVLSPCPLLYCTVYFFVLQSSHTVVYLH